MDKSKLEVRLKVGDLDGELSKLCGAEGVDKARERFINVCQGFDRVFGEKPTALFSAPGRTEIGGNHTDHQHGRVLAAAVDLDLVAAVRLTDRPAVRLQSEGFGYQLLYTDDLLPKEEERNTTAALFRGVTAKMSELGCPLKGKGLDIYASSSVPGGSGLSSSAAFEILIGTIWNELVWDGKASPVEIAQIGQYAENVFFGKPSGLMDQTASAVGGVVAIDFKDPEKPVVDRLDVELHSEGYALCIIESGADHADLTGEYASITDELKRICGHFGKEVLRDVDESEFYKAIDTLRGSAGDRAVLRAMHFYNENRRAALEADALRRGDFAEFLRLVNESGCSSAEYLQNIIPTGQVMRQELMVTLALAKRLLDGRGAARVHGGGFGGTAQAFVPLDMLDSFKSGMESALGEGKCHVVNIRPIGGTRLA